MLNYNDIKERYRLNPEPKEVSEVRNLITDSFSDLEFVEDVHKYYLPINGKKIELPSVSSVIEQWVPEVDWDEKAEMKAVKLVMTKDEMLKQWHETNIRSTSNGSQTHFFGENCMNLFIGREDKVKMDMTFQYTDDGYLIPYAPKEDAVTKYYEDILSNPDIYPVMPEAKVHTAYVDGVKNPYAGTFDILMAYRYKGRIVFSIHDFKTNADIYKDYSRNWDVMMLEPFSRFYEEPFSHYAIQLSLYQIALMNLGIEVVDRNLIWLKDNKTYEKVKTPDLTKELMDII